MVTDVRDGADAADGAPDAPDPSTSGSPGRQQRFEDSPRGRRVINVVIVVFVAVGVIWSLPDSPIGRGLQDAVRPLAAATGLDQYWGMFGTPDTRVESVEVDVQMADGSIRVWKMQPGEHGVGWWDRWILLKRAVIHDSTVRPQLAHWVVPQITKPNEHAVAVAVVMRTENLPKPGEGGGAKSPASRILFQEKLGGTP